MNKRILIVDDERLTRISLAAFLRDAGYQVSIAADGKSAIRMHQERPFDVCIVDIRMPGMNGVETILALHHILPSSRFLIYTGSPTFTLPSALSALGISEELVVYKPVLDMNIFLSLISSGQMRGGGV